MMTQQELMREIEVIPPFAASLMRLTNLILSGEYNIEDVSKIVRFDQGLTVDVIGYANSVESGSIKDITSVHEAIVRMGGARIMRYLLAKWFRGNISASIGTGKEALGFWRHAVLSAVASDILVEQVPSFRHPGAFTACLVHDIGRLPFGLWASRNRIPYDWSLNDAETKEKELAIFGWEHGEVGARVLQKWHFPNILVESVRNHSAETGGPDPITDVIRAANIVCRALENMETAETLAQYTVCKRFNINATALLEMANCTDVQSVQMLQEFGSAS